MRAEPRQVLISALKDFRWLLDRGYAERPAVALVGDRYRLSRTERAVLYRGVCSSQVARRRAARLAAAPAPEAALVVDGYNVLFTVVHYIQGKQVFRSLDGFVRDTGAGSGRISRWALFEEAATRLVEYLAGVSAAPAAKSPPVEVLLDAAMTRSRDHVAALREKAAEQGLSGRWELVEQADRVIEARCRDGAALASADSELIDRTEVPVVDAGGAIVLGAYGGTILDLRELAGE